MSDLTDGDDIVTIDGKQYSRLMAEEMARDIELVASIRPGAWAIGDNSALIVGDVAVLSFELPLKHGFLIDTTNASSEVLETIESIRRSPHLPKSPHLVRIEIPEVRRRDLLSVVRAAHESAIRENLTFFHRSLRWRWHSPDVAQRLSEVVGRNLPQPSYAADLFELKMNDAEPSVGSIQAVVSELDPALLAYIAQDIEVTHRANPNSWALYKIKTGGLVLTVEAIAVAHVAENRWGLLVLGEIDDLAFQAVDRSQTQSGFTYFRGFWIHAESKERFEELATEFADQHRDAIIDLAMRVRTRTQRANGHQPQTLDALSASLGRDLPRPAYETTVSRRLEERFTQTSSNQPDPIDVILNHFESSGLHYSKDLIATFYTALQTKGFVVLSGISGTGKSKIATGFVEMLPAPAAMVMPKRDSYGLMPIVVKPYMKKRRMVAIPSRFHDLLTPMERGASYQLPVSINGKQGTGRLYFRTPNGSDQYLLSFHQILATEINEWTEGQSIYLDIAPNSEADKVMEIRITHDPPDSDSPELPPIDSSTQARNHLFLSVRPDWRDSTSLLGYYNPLTQTYEWTEFLRFIIRAQESYRANDGLAWFVILDEMNLAHVEYYFADLLSVVESGRDRDGWTRESIRLTYPETLDDEAPPQELRLPPNLYLIGTVNMDETTHAFSPKVLDRAFTIELSEVDFLGYQISRVTGDTRLSDAQSQRLLDAFSRYDPTSGVRRFAQIDKTEIVEIVEQEPDIRSYLHTLNRLLQQHRFHFGYRVFDEIAQYLSNNLQNGMMEFIPAFDRAVYMKVLPKFSGSRARLRAPLLSLLTWTFYPTNPEPELRTVQQAFMTLDSEDSTAVVDFTRNAVFPTVAARALSMLIALETDGFVSFG